VITTDNYDDRLWIDEWLDVSMSRSMVDRLMGLVDDDDDDDGVDGWMDDGVDGWMDDGWVGQCIGANKEVVRQMLVSIVLLLHSCVGRRRA